MTDATPLVPPRDSRLSADAIAERNFSPSKRGYAETEVRAFLRLLADEFAGLQARERDLAHRVRELEDEARRPVPPPSDQDLIAALGEETARVLGQARESALELRGKAEDHARRVVREAQESARELRTSAQQVLDIKTREAEDVARARASEIVGEARTVRDRILQELSERRTELERQVGELRGSRGRLVEMYQAVEGVLSQATRVISEEHVPTAKPPAPPTPPEVRSEGDSDSAQDGGADTDALADRDAEPTGAAPRDQPDEAEAESPDVDALFEKLRSEREPAAADAAPAADAAASAAPKATETPVDEGGSDAEGGEAADGDEGEAPLDPDRAAVQARDRALDEIGDELMRKAKRAVQDEQNDMLDGLRRQRGKIDTGKVLPGVDDQVTRWAQVLQPGVERAYGLGAASTAGVAGSKGADTAPPRALAADLARAAVTPLRERVAASLADIDEPTPADTELAIAQRLGARYREWRGEELEAVVADALTAAHARGVYEAVPDGTRLRWISAVVGKCPDCDDNSLEPTTRGADFPTGQPHPPAHPGCRCLLVADVDS
jgi:DivIVA domain-containing protein